MSAMLSPHHVFLAVTALVISFQRHLSPWYISSAPLTYLLLLGQQKGDRSVLPFLPAWLIAIAINVAYAIASTSWLLHWTSVLACFPAIFIVSIYQFDFVADALRRRLRIIIRQLHFIDDIVALFDVPALEIDTDVDGMMVVRGVSISLSTFTIHVYGVEVGIKLTDDMEIALQVDHLSIALFRGIAIGDVYGSLKGGEYEMSTGRLGQNTHDDEGDATMRKNPFPVDPNGAVSGDYKTTKLRDEMTNGSPPKAVSAKEGLESVTKLSGDAEEAAGRYQHTLDYINKTSSIQQCRREAERRTLRGEEGAQALKDTGLNGLRATVCSQLHHKPTIAHPPRRSVKVTTLRNLSSPSTRRFQHRLPMLLRILLNMLSFFHPITIASITFAASGKWLQTTLEENIFKHYPEESSELRKLHARLASWLADANFALELTDILGVAKVPILTQYPIDCDLKMSKILAYRLVPQETDLKQVVTLGGAAARIQLPTFLLPHHEHLLPPRPKPLSRSGSLPTLSPRTSSHGSLSSLTSNGHATTTTPMPATQPDPEQPKDEVHMTISVHASLPATFDQALLNFIAALVKATKLIEMEKDTGTTTITTLSPTASASNLSLDSPDDSSDSASISEKPAHGHRFNMSMSKNMNMNVKEWGGNLKASVKDGMKKTAVDAVVNDKWIAKLVGKVTRKMETVMGDVGYSGDVPLDLAPYRAKAEAEAKLLP